MFERNFVRLADAAADEVTARAERFTARYIDRMGRDMPELVDRTLEPGIQLAIFEAQRDYVRSGDEDVEGVLLELLLQRTADAERSLRQVVVTEALAICGSLTGAQMNALATTLVVHGVAPSPEPSTIEGLAAWLGHNLMPLATDLPGSGSDYTYLIGRGTAISRMTRSKLGATLAQRFAVLSDADAGDRAIEALSPHLPHFDEFATVWRESSLSQIQATAIGIAIGHARWRAVTGATAPLGLWLGP